MERSRNRDYSEPVGPVRAKTRGMDEVVMATLASTASTAGIAAAVAAAASVLTLLATLLVIRLVRRKRQTPEERVAELVRELDLRMRQLGQDLSEELERTKAESRRSRFLGELAWSIDLDEVMRRTLDAAAMLPGVDAALMTILGSADATATAGVGLSDEEKLELAIEGPPRSGRIQSMTIAYAHERERGAVDEPPPVHSSLAVPVEVGGDTIGVISIFTRDELASFGEESLAALEELAARAAPAIDNARRFKEARQLANLDPGTGLHNKRFFQETLAREVARARRYERRLALIVFDLDDLKPVNDKFGHLAGDELLAGVADRVREVLRSADIACRVGGDEFAVVLPESTLEDAELLYARLHTQIGARPIGKVGRVTLSCGIAELEPADDAVSFFKRADDALYRAKEAGKGRVASATTAVRPISDDILRSAISSIDREQ